MAFVFLQACAVPVLHHFLALYFYSPALCFLAPPPVF